MDLAGRTQHEQEFAQRFAALSARHKRELMKLLGDPPDPRNIPAEFWERVKKETEEEAAALMLLILLAGSQQYLTRLESAVTQSGRDIEQTRQQVELSVKRWADSRAADFAQQYTDHSVQIVNKLGQPGEVEQEAADLVDQAFGPSRVESIAVTETTLAASAAGEVAVDATVGRDEQDRWFTAEDSRVCPICSPLHGRTRSQWSRFFPDGPPSHPRCRCWIEYAFEQAKPRAGVRPPELAVIR